MPDASAITAILGPTNTGKTHRAVERMLEHESGIIGLPLRLLAREVYDRITARVGEAQVALVTGEEKRVPKRPAYWVCTVESMPMEREVDFVAVDEVQLAAHGQRGHVFTDRLLRARGRKETYFLGSDTVRGALGELVPTARVEQHPRLSTLRAAGAHKLARLPPRSAVVGFSMPQVVELAERLRALRGGAAVVLGALSPRTRNAQVALFQAGEVDYIVATDAIGMGLNLAVDHVAFASLRKFDGKEARDLEAAELGQIAGRAGRYLADGTFGTVAPLRLPESVEARLVAHRFDPVRRVRWRSADLDFSSVDTLAASLRVPPKKPCLLLDATSEDLAALEALGRDPEVKPRARGEDAVELLWSVCRVPDFRKLLFESHVALLRDVYLQLSGPGGSLDEGWIAETVAGIDDVEGDLDTLMARIASIRTWTYIANQGGWVSDAVAWQERTRLVEDRLSDALHDRLVQRFVDRRAGGRGAPPRRERPASRPGSARAAPDADHPFARLAAFRIAGAPRAMGEPGVEDALVEQLVAARHDAFAIDARGIVSARVDPADDARVVGRLVRGPSLLLPDVKVHGLDELGAGARSRVHRRLVAWARDVVAELLAPLREPPARELSAAGRGVLYQLERGLGTALARDAADQVAALDDGDLARLEALGVVVGRLALFAPALLRRDAMELRAALVRASFGDLAPRLAAAVSSARVGRADARALVACGFVPLGGRAVRVDLAERVAAALATQPSPTAADVARALGCAPIDVDSVAAEVASWQNVGGEPAPLP